MNNILYNTNPQPLLIMLVAKPLINPRGALEIYQAELYNW